LRIKIGGNMKALKILLLFIPTIILAGCSTLPDPEKSDSSLLIGSIVMHVSNVDSQYGLNVNGNQYDNITLKIYDPESKEIDLVTNKDGYFVTDKVIPGYYYLEKMGIKITNEHAYQTMSIVFSKPYPRIQIEPGKVNNIGIIEWYYDGEEGTRANFDAKYRDINNYYTENYNNSKWWERETVELPIMGKY
jgi:hypothetical protein